MRCCWSECYALYIIAANSALEESCHYKYCTFERPPKPDCTWSTEFCFGQ